MSEETRADRHDRGFSLVEVLIVIVVLGILATVVVFAVRGVAESAEENACLSERKTLSTAVEAYFAQNLTDVLPATGVGNDRFEQTLVVDDLINEVSGNWDLDAAGVLAQEAGAAC